jgi:hypothetical protein
MKRQDRLALTHPLQPQVQIEQSDMLHIHKLELRVARSLVRQGCVQRRYIRPLPRKRPRKGLREIAAWRQWYLECRAVVVTWKVEPVTNTCYSQSDILRTLAVPPRLRLLSLRLTSSSSSSLPDASGTLRLPLLVMNALARLALTQNPSPVIPI